MRLLPLAFLLLCGLGHAAAPTGDVVVVPMGKVDEAFVQAAVKAIEARVTVPVRVDAPRPLPQSAWYAPRKRYRAEKVLDAVEADLPARAFRVVVITSAELSTTKGAIFDWGIAGLGNIGGPSCVASTFLYTRHSKSKAVALRRFTDVAVHEFGHTLGMDHCDVAGCVMADAKGKAMKSADQSRGHFCLRCRAKAPPLALRPWGGGAPAADSAPPR